MVMAVRHKRPITLLPTPALDLLAHARHVMSECPSRHGKVMAMDGTSGTGGRKPRVVGINHVALEVGDIDAALEFYGRIFDFTLRGRGEGSATVDMGDQFINFFRGTA